MLGRVNVLKALLRTSDINDLVGDQIKIVEAGRGTAEQRESGQGLRPVATGNGVAAYIPEIAAVDKSKLRRDGGRRRIRWRAIHAFEAGGGYSCCIIDK